MEINSIRCTLILLVILIHCTPFKDAYPAMQNAILAFVVPLFLFITGYLFNVDKTWRQFGQYLWTMTMMYAVFETAYTILSYFFPVRDGIDVLSLGAVVERLLLHPIGPYWYLHTMIICGGVYYLSHRVCSRLGSANAMTWTLLMAVALSYYTPLLSLSSPLAFFAGVAVRRRYGEFGGIFKGSAASSIIAIMTVAYAVCTNKEYATQLSYFSIVLGICVVEFTVWYTRRMDGTLSRAIGYIGANTLPIYLLHPIFTLLSKRLLHDMVENGNILCFCIITLSSAVAGSIAIGCLMDSAGLSRLLFRKNMMRQPRHTASTSRQLIEGVDKS